MLSLIAGVFFFQWKPRRVASDNGPRTIQAIRQEAANVSDIQIIGAFCHLFITVAFGASRLVLTILPLMWHRQLVSSGCKRNKLQSELTSCLCLFAYFQHSLILCEWM